MEVNRIAMMSRKGMFCGVAVLLGTAAVYANLRWPAPDPRICDQSLYRLEKELGRNLYAPTWLPEGFGPKEDGTLQGSLRVLSNYEEPRAQGLIILAQEPRSSERDSYHEKRILPGADLLARVGQHQAYFIRGRYGERRLFWATPDSWLVVSSHALSDDDLLRVARSVRGPPQPPPPAGGVAQKSDPGRREPDQGSKAAGSAVPRAEEPQPRPDRIK